MTKKTFILDTNVLLFDSNSLLSFDNNNIIIPLVVIEELDKHKDRQDDAGRNAREISRKLSSLLKNNKNIKKGIILENGAVLQILGLEDIKKVHTFTELNSKNSNDNLILTFCKSFQKERKDIVLVSRDILIRIKGESIGIKCEDYKKEKVIADDGSLYSGILNLDVKQETIDAFYSGGKTALDLLGKDVLSQLYPNEFIVLKVKDSSSSAVGRFISADKPLKKLNEKLTAWGLKAKNKEQLFALDVLLDDNIKLVTLAGPSGTGKSILACATSLEQIITLKKYKKLVVTRPIVSTGNEIGFLPGSLEEKLQPWLGGIKDNLEFLLNENYEDAEDKGATFKKSKKKPISFMFQEYIDRGIIELEATSMIRGRSIPDVYFIIEECQNLSKHELKTVLTRVSEGTKIILTGDVEQIDSPHLDYTTNGLSIAIEKFKEFEIAAHVSLKQGERSELATLASKILV